jgi:hypothetical protein
MAMQILAISTVVIEFGWKGGAAHGYDDPFHCISFGTVAILSRFTFWKRLRWFMRD